MITTIVRFAAMAAIAVGVSVCAGTPAMAGQTVLETITADGTKTDFDMEALKALPAAKIVTETTWTTPGKKVVFTGVLLSDILKKSGLDGVESLSYGAGNDYAVDIPTSDAGKYNVIIAYEQDGVALDPADKGPLWVMYPFSDHSEITNDKIYLSRAIWQLKTIEAK